MGSNRSPPSSSAPQALLVVGILSTLALVWGLGALQGSEYQRRDQTPASYARAAKADAERACAGREASAVFECIYEKVEASKQQAHDEQDLSAQQRAAFANLASAIVAFLTLVLSGVALWYLKGTLEATREAVHEAGEGTRAALIAAEAGREANAIARSSNRPIMVFTGYRIEPWDSQGTESISREFAQVLLIPVWVNLGPMPALIIECECYRRYTAGNPTEEDLTALIAQPPAQSENDVKLIPPNGRYEGPGVMITGREAGVRDQGEFIAAKFGGPRYVASKFVLHIGHVTYKAAIGASERWETEQIAALIPGYADNGYFTTSGWGSGPLFEGATMLKMT